MTALPQPLFLTVCDTCNGSTRVAENPDDPGDGWTVPCPRCSSSGELLERKREYDPERAEVPF